jgi:hypothetical protein
MMFDFETHSSRLDLGITACLLLASTISVAMPQTLRDVKPTIEMINWEGQRRKHT